MKRLFYLITSPIWLPYRLIVRNLPKSRKNKSKRYLWGRINRNTTSLTRLTERLVNDIKCLWDKITEVDNHAALAADKADIIGNMLGHSKIVAKVNSLERKINGIDGDLRGDTYEAKDKLTFEPVVEDV